ncbi:MAG: hypothetical protein AAF384_03590 [Pseudomonadota bacterium]
MTATATISLPVGAISDLLNADAEFQLTARFWDADIRFLIGDDSYFMTIKQGRVESFQLGRTGFDPYTINVAGPVAVWDKMFDEKPDPFYHDWFAASFHHDFEIGGDLASAYAYYYALRRIHALMGKAVREAS